MLWSATSSRIQAVKLLDWLLGRLLLWTVRASPATASPVAMDRIRRILVIRPGGIGDAVLLIPFLKGLAAMAPSATIDLVVESRNAGVLQAAGVSLGRCLLYDQAPWRVWRTVRTEPYDLVCDTEQWHHLSAWLAQASGASIRVGFDTNPRRNACYTLLVPYRHDQFEGESFLQMLEALSGHAYPVTWGEAFVHLPPEVTARAEQIIGGRKVVAISLRGSIRERCWPLTQWTALCRHLMGSGYTVAVLGTRDDVVFSRRLAADLSSDQLLDLVGQTSLRETLAVLSRCRLFIGTDSGPMHLAAAVGTPTVSLFGAGIEAKWAPKGSQHRVLNHRLPCSPCTRFGYTPRCPIQVRCLQEIAADEVVRACEDVLAMAR